MNNAKSLTGRLVSLARIGAILAVTVAAGCDGIVDHASHDHDHAAEADYERGPNRGRLLTDGPFGLEITIFETGVPPRFHVYPSSTRRGST